MNFFYSDPHFGHYNVILYSKRPFLFEAKGREIFFNSELVKAMASEEAANREARKLSVELMENTLVENWNKKVSAEDTVYVVGDFAFSSPEEMTRILKRLNGKKIIILGNHDKSAAVMKECGFDDAVENLTLVVNGTTVVLNHYPYLDPELNEIAKLRPNIIKLNSLAKELPQVPETFDYEASKEFLKLHYSTVINFKYDSEKTFFHFLKRAISTHIGSRLINNGELLFHGHSHSEEKRFANRINLSVEAWGYSPVSELELIPVMDEYSKEINVEEINEATAKNSVYDYYASLKLPKFKALTEMVNAFKEAERMPLVMRVPGKASPEWYAANKKLKRFIPRENLVPGKFYEGRCRNAQWAYWNGKKFFYLRTKFTSEFVEAINCLEEDNGFDLFIPHAEITLEEEVLNKFYTKIDPSNL